jgi:predicted Zn-dependent peptidase
LYCFCRHSLKASTLLAAEDPNVLVEEIATQSLNAGQVISLKDYEKAVDSITVQDITTLANKITKSKGAMASVGPLQNVPYLEDLL